MNKQRLGVTTFREIDVGIFVYFQNVKCANVLNLKHNR